MMALLFMNLGGGGDVFVAWVFFCSGDVGSQKSKRELTSPFLLDSKQDLCAADF
jgi:hypothetical protein